MSSPLERLAERAGLVARGPSKVTTLERAIRTHIAPGMHLHLTSGLTRPQASCYEIMRAFRGRRPGFTLSCMSLAGPNVLLVDGGLVERLVTTFHGDSYPTPGPNAALQRAFEGGEFTISAWSILSHTQRLLAGALRLPFMPTNSLAGSSMALDNPDVVEIDGQLCVRPLHPDVAIVHAPAADPSGNTLLGGPFGDGGLGAWAARHGAIVTVERIVAPEVVAAHSPQMRIPGTLVRAVVEAPFGAHPGPLFAAGLTDAVEPYAEDGEFAVEFREACRDPAELEAWRKEWVLSGGHDAYLERLGPRRLAALRGRAQYGSWRDETNAARDRILRADPPTPAERAAVSGGRALATRMRTSGLTTVLAGVGISNLAAWLARSALAADGTGIDLMVELGLFGYVPPLGDPLIVSNRTVPTSSGLGGVLDILGLGLAGTPSAGAIGAGEVDRFANLNSSRTADGRLLVGSGGANDVASICREVVVICEQSARRFVEAVGYVTAPGHRVRVVATQLGIYERDESGELVLTGVFGPVRDGVAAAKAACGWPLRTAGRVARLPEPTRDEITLLRAYDPDGRYLGVG